MRRTPFDAMHICAGSYENTQKFRAKALQGILVSCFLFAASKIQKIGTVVWGNCVTVCSNHAPRQTTRLPGRSPLTTATVEDMRPSLVVVTGPRERTTGPTLSEIRARAVATHISNPAATSRHRRLALDKPDAAHCTCELAVSVNYGCYCRR